VALEARRLRRGARCDRMGGEFDAVEPCQKRPSVSVKGRPSADVQVDSAVRSGPPHRLRVGGKRRYYPTWPGSVVRGLQAVEA